VFWSHGSRFIPRLWLFEKGDSSGPSSAPKCESSLGIAQPVYWQSRIGKVSIETDDRPKPPKIGGSESRAVGNILPIGPMDSCREKRNAGPAEHRSYLRQKLKRQRFFATNGVSPVCFLELTRISFRRNPNTQMHAQASRGTRTNASRSLRRWGCLSFRSTQGRLENHHDFGRPDGKARGTFRAHPQDGHRKRRDEGFKSGSMASKQWQFGKKAEE